MLFEKVMTFSQPVTRFLIAKASRFGFTVYRNKFIDQSESPLLTEHPLSLLLEIPPHSQLLVSVPVDRLRSWGGRTIELYNHPLLDTISEYFLKGIKEYTGSALETFANRNNPVDAAETLGVEKTAAPGFRNLSPLMALYPWESGNPTDCYAFYKRTLRHELGSSSLKVLELLQDRDARGRAEFERLIHIGKVIKENGFNVRARNFEHIQGELLVDNQLDWKVLIRQGEHRVAALSAFGTTEIPVVLSPLKIVRELESACWPQVAKGRLNSDAALDVFQRIKLGRDDAPLVNVVGWP
jgi:hypothetical protein